MDTPTPTPQEVQELVRKLAESFACVTEEDQHPDCGEIIRKAAVALSALQQEVARLRVDQIARAIQAARPVARFTVQTPWKREDGFAPVETHAPCLYTQVKTCREIYPDQPEMQCQFCLGNAHAEPVASGK
jgi:hypothetical protein